MQARQIGKFLHYRGARGGSRRLPWLLLSCVLLVSAATASIGLSAGAATAAPANWIWSDSTKPTSGPDSDTVPVEVGVRLVASTPGSVDAIRYYKLSAMAPATQATLWGPSGEVLARASFPSATSSTAGWQVATLTRAVSLRANSTYVASYTAPAGRYAADQRSLSESRPFGSLGISALAGVFSYNVGTYPTKVWNDSNYFVDVRFSTGASVSSASAPVSSTRTTASAPATTTAPTSGRCIGPANTPGGPDPWGGCWPGPQNTGYPKGLPGDTRTPVTLTTYTGPTTIRSCGVVIDSKVVNETILVQASNGTHSASTPCVTIRNSLVKGVIFAEQSNHGPVLVTDTEVVPPDLPWWENIGRNNMFVYRVNSHGGQAVIKCDSYCAAKDNWVHGMTLGMQYHYNAFGGNGTNQFVIDHNWASCGDWAKVSSPGGDAGCSAAIGFYGDFAPIQNIKINRNFLAGMRIDPSVSNAQSRQPGYCLNPGFYPGKPYPAPSNVSVTENIFGRGDNGKCGVYGPTNSLNSRSNTNGNVWSNNRFEDGTSIARVEE